MYTIDQLFSDKYEYGSFYDTLNELYDVDYSVEDMRTIFSKLPQHLQDDAHHWGLSDSVVRDNIYEYLQDYEIRDNPRKYENP